MTSRNLNQHIRAEVKRKVLDNRYKGALAGSDASAPRGGLSRRLEPPTHGGHGGFEQALEASPQGSSPKVWS